MSVDPDHSVTCAICGGLVDERRSVEVWPDELSPAIRIDATLYWAAVHAIADRYGCGEIHQHCYDDFVEHELRTTKV